MAMDVETKKHVKIAGIALLAAGVIIFFSKMISSAGEKAHTKVAQTLENFTIGKDKAKDAHE